MTKQILFVSHTGELGGAELMLLDVAHHYHDRCRVVLFADGPLRQRLAAQGVFVSLLAADRDMLKISRQEGGLRAVIAGPAIAATVWRLCRLGRFYDVLYPNSQKAAVVALLAGRMIGKPVVWHLHDIMSPEHFGGAQRKAMVTLANHGARRVIANSEACRDAFVAAGGNGERVTIAPNGIDPKPFEAVSEADIQTIREELGVGDAPLIGLFGRISPWKGQHVLIEALARLDGAHAIIVGDALFGETGYRDALRAQAQALGLTARVHWLGFRDDVPRLMRAVDVVVHTSILPEPFGRVIIEGMLARRLVIATAHGAATELLGADYELLVHPGDAAALAEALTYALRAAPAVLQHWTEVNYQRARTLFSTERMLAEIDGALGYAA